MFNGHFYEEGAAVGEEEGREVGGEEGREVGGEEVCREFLHSRVVAIVIDPPFGGLVEVLARQVRRLWNMAGEGVWMCVCIVCVCFIHVCIIHRGEHCIGVSILYGATCQLCTVLPEDV